MRMMELLGILSFVIAVFAIEMKLNPKLQGVSLKNKHRIDTDQGNRVVVKNPAS